MHRWRCWCLFLGVSVTAIAGCSKPNPAYNCINSTCIDPNYPYCDADGSIDGTPGVCIAVTCDSGAFGACNADTALTCNDTGTGYTQTQCAHGCDPTTGCKLCEANQTVCQNGVVATCDASGAQTSTTNCPLGCFEDQPRCRDVDPSNHFGTYFDMVPTPADLDLTGNTWYITLSTGAVTDFTTMLTPTSFLAPSLGGGPPTRVFVVNNLKLGNISVIGPNDGSSISAAFLASGDIAISGTVTVSTGAGATHSSACVDHPGYASSEPNGATILVPGGGGGGASMGSSGGRIQDGSSPIALAGGNAYGTDDLQPLVGGCSAGGFNNQNSGENYLEGSWGGGAIQFTSRTSITVNGVVRADGDVGGSDHDQGPMESRFGGGGGGGILLEAPVVALGPNSTVSAAGGDGYGCNPAQATCGLPGLGGTGSAAAVAGGDVQFTTALGSSAEFTAGTGGGGVGRVRINTPTGSYTLDATATRNALVTTGPLKTR